jgi:hypothetical protein
MNRKVKVSSILAADRQEDEPKAVTIAEPFLFRASEFLQH